MLDLEMHAVHVHGLATLGEPDVHFHLVERLHPIGMDLDVRLRIEVGEGGRVVRPSASPEACAPKHCRRSYAYSDSHPSSSMAPLDAAGVR